MRRATVSGPSSPSPAPRIEGRRNQLAPTLSAGRLNRLAGKMPVGPRAVNDDTRTRFSGLIDGGWRPPCAISSLEQTPRTTQEYGLSAARHELRHCLFGDRRKFRLTAARYHSGQENGHFWLTTLRAEAYIQAIGAPSAYGAIARLWSSSLEQWIGIRWFSDARASTALRLTEGWGPPWFPGCLKSESEERETWTAESLRAAFAWRSNSSWEAALEETSAVHV